MAKVSELKKIENEIIKEEKMLEKFAKNHKMQIILSTIVFVVLIGAIIYLSVGAGRIFIEKSEISAPVISLTSVSGGVLEEVFVKEGDYIPANTIVAKVNGVSIKSMIEGLVIKVQNTPGQIVSSQTSIVQMISPKEMKVVGHIEEDKGLSDIKVGQRVIFTIDAFGSKQYPGIVDSIGASSRQGDVVFSISDKRQEKEFDVKVSFDVNAYPELKNGMSAKMWVYQ